MTQQIYNLDWFSSNEMRKYPIDSAASFVPVGYDSVPAGLMGVITDISFSLPSTYESDDDTCTGIPYLSALSITEDLITLIICVDKIVDESRVVEPLFAFSSTQRSLYTNRYYDLKSFADGCSGVIVFGESAKTLRGGYKFFATEARFLPSVYHKYTVFPVTSLGIQGQSSYRGNIILKGTGDIKVDTEEMTIGDYKGKVITVGLDYDSSEDTIYKYNGSCDVRPVSDTCARTSIESIGVAFPNEEGNIDIKGDGIYVYMADGQLVLSTDYTLDDICVKDKFNDLIGEDYCQVQEEEEEEPDTGCGSSPKSVNFSSEVYPQGGEGIEISSQGIQPISGVVQLDIPVLADIQYLSVRVARPEAGGYCKITYGQGQDYILIETDKVTDSVSRSYSLLNTDTHTYPHRVTVVLDRCNGVKRVDGDSSEIFSGNTATSSISASIELKGCTLESVKYKKESSSSSGSSSGSSGGSEGSSGSSGDSGGSVSTDNAYTEFTAIGPGEIVFGDTIDGYWLGGEIYDENMNKIGNVNIDGSYSNITLNEGERVWITTTSNYVGYIRFYSKLQIPIRNREGKIIDFTWRWEPDTWKWFYIHPVLDYFLIASCTATVTSSTKYVAPEGE